MMEKSLHEICVEAVNQMVAEGITRHVSFLSVGDEINPGLVEVGKVPKVTIEFVDESEAESPEV